MNDPPRFTVAAIDLFERDVHLRLPFRFGSATVHQAPQAFVRATIRDADGRESTGWTAEMMIPKWFDKRPGQTHGRNIDDLRAALGLARDAYTSERAARTAFGHASYHYEALQAAGAARGLNALVMAYGAALADRATLDAMTREKMNLELQRIWFETRKTVLFITHSIPEAVFLADRVLVMSERPGTIAAIYDVALPRPRSLAMMGDPAFVDLTQTIRRHFYAQGTLDG